jgi:hypothetical protein
MKPQSPTPLERVALSAGGVGIAVTVLLVFSPFVLGLELDCFPGLEGVAKGMIGLGAFAALLSLVSTAACAAASLGLQRTLSAPLRKALVTAVLCLPMAMFGAVTLELRVGAFVSHSDFCSCKPGGLLGAVAPSLWQVLYDAAGEGPLSRAGARSVETIDARPIR